MYEVIRRLIFPVVLAILAIGLFVQSKAADKDADRPALVVSEPAAPRLSTPLLSARRLPEQLQTPEANRRLVARIRAANLLTNNDPHGGAWIKFNKPSGFSMEGSGEGGRSRRRGGRRRG